MVPTTLIATAPEKLIRLLHTSSTFSDRFLACMLKRNVRIERDLTEQLFNNSEKRLARTLLLLSQYGSGATPRRIPRCLRKFWPR
jgi:CRP-like cAMP-binding protein